MSDELKPCPFCGAGVELKYIVSDHAIYCPECDRHFWEQEARHPHPGRAGLIEWWNTRAERTCHMVPVSLYVEGIECDVCGWSDMHDCDDPMPDRCPGCGRKAVAE